MALLQSPGAGRRPPALLLACRVARHPSTRFMLRCMSPESWPRTGWALPPLDRAGRGIYASPGRPPSALSRHGARVLQPWRGPCASMLSRTSTPPILPAHGRGRHRPQGHVPAGARRAVDPRPRHAPACGRAVPGLRASPVHPDADAGDGEQGQRRDRPGAGAARQRRPGRVGRQASQALPGLRGAGAADGARCRRGRGGARHQGPRRHRRADLLQRRRQAAGPARNSSRSSPP